MGHGFSLCRHDVSGYGYCEWLRPAAGPEKLGSKVLKGMLIRNSINLEGSGALIAVGTFESFSAGILLHASIATLLLGDWIHGEMLEASRKRIIIAAAFTAVVGAFSLNLII